MERRSFLRAVAVGAGALAVSASGLLTLAPPSAGPGRGGGGQMTRSYTLRAREGTMGTVDGKTLYARGFADGDRVLTVPGPVLWANEGDAINITLENDSLQDHAVAVQGVAAGPLVPPSGKATLSFTAPRPGAYGYYDPTASPLNRALGMYGALVVMPLNSAGDEVWDGGPRFSRQYLQIVSELDESWNTLAGLGQLPDVSAYRPNYFFLNGRGFPDSELDPNVHIRGTVGETILLRWVNAGLVPHSLHTHGYHFRIVQVNGVPQLGFREKDNVPVYPLQTLDVLIRFDQPGQYPIHDHILMANTGNGVYPKGIMGMFDVVQGVV